jgi:hydrogenase nickel incorporation protein HypA/HybF
MSWRLGRLEIKTVMHELSIVMSIVEIASEQVQLAGAREVTRIELEIGALSGIALAALDFAWDVGVKDTVLAGAERHIHAIAGRARCSDCGAEFGIAELYDACPQCNGYFHQVLSGQEMRIKWIEVR